MSFFNDIIGFSTILIFFREANISLKYRWNEFSVRFKDFSAKLMIQGIPLPALPQKRLKE